VLEDIVSVSLITEDEIGREFGTYGEKINSNGVLVNSRERKIPLGTAWP
jgi:hypothetical protein